MFSPDARFIRYILTAMQMKKLLKTIRIWIRNVFGFSGREVNGFIILLPLMLLIILAEPIYHLWVSNRVPDFTTETKILDSLKSRWATAENAAESGQLNVLFDFNPNTASIDELRTLGFSESLSTRIANYRQKGGQFRIKSDLLKIYGIDSSFYHQLYSHILLPERNERNFTRKDSSVVKHKRNDLLVSFDLNTADSAQLKSIYGIGPTLAARIIRFRSGLGGFIKGEQLNEVYGLDSAVVKRLRKVSFIANDFVPKKINMNEAGEKELSAHPYIKRNVANALVAYRFQHGNFRHVEDIRKVSMLKPEEIERILPYLKVAD